jgi:hypothetical protein
MFDEEIPMKLGELFTSNTAAKVESAIANT